MPVGRAVVGAAVDGDIVLSAAFISRAVVGLAVADCVTSLSTDGTSDDTNVGCIVDSLVVGTVLGDRVGLPVGSWLGEEEGTSLGSPDVVKVGLSVGS